jgi:hypothetical protein
LGLAVLPAPDDDGKSVKGTIAGFNKFKKRIPKGKTEDRFNSFPDANIAILPHLCSPRLVVVDCDDDAALAAAEARYGYSPLLVSTPRGSGGHLYYHAPSQVRARSRNLRRSHGLAIDVKAGPGAVVIVPPSVRPSTGRPYAFSRGSWDDLRSLPVFSEPRHRRHRPSSIGVSQPVEEGHRNQHLFRALLRRARGCETLGELENIAAVLNERDYSPPLPWAEVVTVTRSAWGYEEQGCNWVGGQRRVGIVEADFAALADEPHAWTLFCKLHFEHRKEHRKLRDRFAISPKAMAQSKVLPGWTMHGYRKAIEILVQRGFLQIMHEGGRGQRDPRLFSFADMTCPKGAKSEPNTNRTPSPLPLTSPAVPTPRRRAA